MGESPTPHGGEIRRALRGFVEDVILASRYLLVPLYVALLIKILTITVDFFQVLRGVIEPGLLTEHTLQTLELLDITMIANLIYLIAAGSYYVFVDNNYPDTSGKKRPRGLTHVSAGILKEKMAGSLIGVSSVHLLEMFLHISTSQATVNVINMGVLIVIHLMFIVGLWVFNIANAADHHSHNQDQSKGKESAHAEAHH